MAHKNLPCAAGGQKDAGVGDGIAISARDVACIAHQEWIISAYQYTLLNIDLRLLVRKYQARSPLLFSYRKSPAASYSPGLTAQLWLID